MKKNLIWVFAVIAILFLGYIIYDEIITDDVVYINECDKEELCDECICDNDFDNSYVDDEEDPLVNSSKIYTKDGKILKLDVYSMSNIKTINVKLNGKNKKIENINDVLYVNGKQVAENTAGNLYVTNNYMIVTYASQIGGALGKLVDENDKVTNIEGNKTIGSFEGEEFYLSESGDIVIVGGAFCGIECTPKKEIVTLSYTNGKLNITKK